MHLNKKARIALLIVLAVIFAGSAGMYLYQLFQYREGSEIYDEAEALAGLPDLSDLPLPSLPDSPDTSAPSDSSQASEPEVVYVDPYADALRNMDFTALREVNDDVLGWILIPGTNLSYPVVQGGDNSYYLNHTWKKTRNSVGAIFLEHTNSRDLSDFNTIIYGHRMNDRSMFGILKHYQDLSYWSDHPCIYITDDYGSHTYEVFAAYEVSVEGDTYRLGFSSDASKQSFIDFCLEQSVIDTGVVPRVYDRILTLSTCTGSGHATRWVVQAVLRGEAPADDAAQEEEPGTDTETPPAEETPPTAGTEEPAGDTSQTSEQPDPSQPSQDIPEDGPISQDILDDIPISQDIPREETEETQESS